MRLQLYPDIQLDVDVTPPAWQMPRRGEGDMYLTILRLLFPEHCYFVVGPREVTVRLMASPQIGLADVHARAYRARLALFGLRDSLLRERTVDSGERDAMREKLLERFGKGAG